MDNRNPTISVSLSRKNWLAIMQIVRDYANMKDMAWLRWTQMITQQIQNPIDAEQAEYDRLQAAEIVTGREKEQILENLRRRGITVGNGDEVDVYRTGGELTIRGRSDQPKVSSSATYRTLPPLSPVPAPKTYADGAYDDDYYDDNLPEYQDDGLDELRAMGLTDDEIWDFL